jgi:hypothetical protein
MKINITILDVIHHIVFYLRHKTFRKMDYVSGEREISCFSCFHLSRFHLEFCLWRQRILPSIGFI